MDEDQFRSTYNEVNPNRCIFEKAITNRRCDCSLKHKFVMATRECVACQSEAGLKRCTRVLNAIRDNSRFALKVVTIDGPMPHNKELQVQAGGMLALQSLFSDDTEKKTVSNIHQTMEQAMKQYDTLEHFPFGEIVKSIVKYQSRPKRNKNK